MSKIPVKFNSKITVIPYEELIIRFLHRNTPPAMTSQDIADKLDVPYPTIHPKLKELHQKGIIKGEKDMTPRPGKQRLLWQKSGGDVDSILERWQALVSSH